MKKCISLSHSENGHHFLVELICFNSQSKLLLRNICFKIKFRIYDFLFVSFIHIIENVLVIYTIEKIKEVDRGELK